MSTLVTTGWYRQANVTARSTYGLNLQVTPGASIYVTNTSNNLAANIYSDPLLTALIPNSIVTADVNGNYAYYLPLNSLVTENISSPNSGTSVIPNIGIAGIIVGSLTTTNATTDTFTATGIISTCHVQLTPTNSSAATMYTSTYVSAKNSGNIVITHPATAGGTFDIFVTPY